MSARFWKSSFLTVGILLTFLAPSARAAGECSLVPPCTPNVSGYSCVPNSTGGCTATLITGTGSCTADTDCNVSQKCTANACVLVSCTTSCGVGKTCTHGQCVEAPTPVSAPTSTPTNPYPFNQALTNRLFVTPDLEIDIPGVTFTPALERDGHMTVDWIAQYIAGVYKYLLGIAVMVAIVMIMIGGLQYVLSVGGGDIGKAKKRINDAVVGLILLFSIYLILTSVYGQRLTLFEPIRLLTVKSIFVSQENTAQDVTNLNLPAPTTGGTSGGVPYFSQRDYLQKYGVCGTIKSSGCGPTSAAMVLKNYGLGVDPLSVATTFAQEGYRACPNPADCSKCQGTSYAAFQESSLVKNNFRSTVIPIGDKEKIIETLKNGKPLLISIGPSKFTGGGHFMVLTGYKDGRILLHDPNSGYKDATEAEVLPFLKYVVLIEPK